jgi:ubiquinone/menaquinone biosynthesis C-methylase UbiE
MRHLLLVLATVSVQAPAPRVPAPVMSYRGASWLEREGREEEQRPDAIFQAMGLKDGDVVADVGCGTGWFARKMARIVAPHGKVFAVDIQPEMLDLAREYAQKDGVTVEPILGTPRDPKLPPGGLDWVLMVDVYHEFQEPQEMLEGIRHALKPKGKVALVEYRLEDNKANVRPEHRMSVEQVLSEWVPAGFHLVEKLEFLPTQHFFIFEAS